MIEIANVDKNRRMFGPHLYELRLNGRVVGTFAHTREDGLTVCLQLAAKVAEKEKWGGLRALMEVSHDQP
jgi:hypothetical protein